MAQGYFSRLNRIVGGVTRPKLGDIVAALWSARHIGGGLAPNSDTTKFDVAAWRAVIDGVPSSGNAATAQVLTGMTPTAITTSVQFQKILVTGKRAGTLGIYSGAKASSQGKALKPVTPVGEIELGWIELPTSFTAGTTAITSGMCKQGPLPADAVGQLGY